MAKAYYSTVFDKSVDEVWAIIKDFNDDRWSGEVTESASENGKSGSTVGTIRNHKFRDTRYAERAPGGHHRRTG